MIIKQTNAHEDTRIFLQYRSRKPPMCFGHQLWPSSGKCSSKDILQRSQKRHTTSMVIRHTQHLNTPHARNGTN